MSVDDYDESLNESDWKKEPEKFDFKEKEAPVDGIESDVVCDCGDECNCDMNPCKCHIDAVPAPLTDEEKFERTKQKLRDA